MKGTIVRSIVSVAIGSLLAVSTSGIAAASVSDNGTGSSGTEAAGASVLELRDQLTEVAYAGDVGATKATMSELEPLLAQLAAGERYAVPTESQQVASDASTQAGKVGAVLANPEAAPRQAAQVPELPPLPSPLSMLNGLLQSLLLTLSGLVGGLLGSAPPLPVPPTPAPPVPMP